MTEAVILSTHTMGYGVIKSLGIMRIPITAIHYNKSDMGYLSKYVQEQIISPHPEKKEKEFIDLLLNLGKRKNKPILIPANDETLVPVSKYKSDLEKYFVVACTNHSTMLKFISKENTYEIAEKLGIPIPKTFNVASFEELHNISAQLVFPCILKPKQSHLYFALFKKKMTIVNNINELKNEFIKAYENGLGCIVQEYIPGDESCGVNFNSYRYSDSSCIKFTAKKVRYSEAGIGIPTCVVSVENINEIEGQALKLLEVLDYVGYSCIEFKFDERDGKYKLMEMNGRHNRSTLLSLKCGLNFPYIEYLDLTLNKKIKNEYYEKGVYWIDFFKDLESLPKRLIKDKYPTFTFFRPYLSKKVFSEISLDDIKPSVKRFYDAFRILLQK